MSFLTSVLRYTGSIILKTVYGYETLDSDDPMIAIANPVLSKIGEVTEPGYLVELLPWRNVFCSSVILKSILKLASQQCVMHPHGFHIQASSKKQW